MVILNDYKNVSIERHIIMSHIKGKDTSIELILRKALWKRGYRYRKNYKLLPGTPDIVFLKQKIAIFCDSEFFHGKDWEMLRDKLEKGNNPDYWINKIETNRKRDMEIDKRLEADGWKVMHFWGKDIINKTEECIKIVEECIVKRGV